MKKLSLSQRFSRLQLRLHDPAWRQYGALLLTGKLVGVGLLVLGIVVLFPDLIGFGKVFAADAVVKSNDIINPINTVWTLVAAFLVFGMQVGFTMLEAGFCRSRETVNVLMECIVDTCLCGILFYAFGFSFMFSHGNGLIGYNWFFLNGVPATYEGTGVAFLAFWLFQFAFADTCSTITSGAMIGRTGYVGGAMLPHDLTIAASGGLLLLFGWYGFNPGSTLSAMDFDGIGRVAANTTLAACSAGLIAMAFAYSKSKTWDVGFTVNGFLAGLVAITCPCYWVSPTGAIALGAVAGVVVVLGVELLEWLRIDGPIGAVPVHGCCGIWGTLSLGFFAWGKYGATGPLAPDNSAPLKGLFYGGGTQLLAAQAIGSLIVTV